MRNSTGILQYIFFRTPSLLHEVASELDQVIYGLCTMLVELPIRTGLHPKRAGQGFLGSFSIVWLLPPIHHFVQGGRSMYLLITRLLPSCLLLGSEQM